MGVSPLPYVLMLLAVAHLVYTSSLSNRNDPTTCNENTCGPAQECYLQQIQCFIAPCPPIPACRPDRCAVMRCVAGCKNGKCLKPTGQ